MIAKYIKFFISLLMIHSCTPYLTDEPIPFVAFVDIRIDLDLYDYISLKRDKGFLEITDSNAGVRGIILYRHNQTRYIAYEKNCSYHPNEACATVNVHFSGLYMNDSCCGSAFDFVNGTPTGGPAWRPLRIYQTQLKGSQLIISDEIVR